jgi:hypothetical protein
MECRNIGNLENQKLKRLEVWSVEMVKLLIPVNLVDPGIQSLSVLNF